MAHYITSDSRSLFLENYEYSSFDLEEEDKVRIEVYSSRMEGQILSADTPAGLIEQYTQYSGRMHPLRGWILSGAVVGLQGGTERVRGIQARLEASGAPVSAYWLQDWVGSGAPVSDPSSGGVGPAAQGLREGAGLPRKH